MTYIGKYGSIAAAISSSRTLSSEARREEDATCEVNLLREEDLPLLEGASEENLSLQDATSEVNLLLEDARKENLPLLEDE